MIMTVEEFRSYVDTDKTDAVLSAKLAALELLIRKYTNNNFQHRGFRCTADTRGSIFSAEALQPFDVGDTIQVTESQLNAGLYTVTAATDTTFEVEVSDALRDENDVLVTKVVYPIDVKMGVANMLEWDLNNRSKVGIQSETISRHSVTYFSMDGDNASMGYPKSLTGFLKPYMKARF